MRMQAGAGLYYYFIATVFFLYWVSSRSRLPRLAVILLANYFFCAVCDFENGFLTLLTNRLWASEVIRRLRPVLDELPVEVARPQ